MQLLFPDVRNLSKGFSENSVINFAGSLTATTAVCNAEADEFALSLSPFFFGDVISSGTL